MANSRYLTSYKMSSLTADELRRQLRYEPLTGLFWWLIARRGRQLNRPAGTIGTMRSGNPACQIMIDGRKYYANVLAWLWMTGDWPTDEVDHTNTDSLDNRWTNLRLATRSQQNMNRRSKRPYLTGASFHKPSGRWQAYIKKDGKQIPLGYYASAEQAHEAYKKAAAELFGEFAHSSIKYAT